MKNIDQELSEGSFRDFIKAGMLGAGLALSSPVANAAEAPQTTIAQQAAVIPLSSVPKALVKEYNLKKDISAKSAQDMAELALTKVGDAALDGDPVHSDEWLGAEDTYKQLASLDYKIATAFLGKFNVSAKKLFGVQIRPVAPKVAESVEDTDVFSTAESIAFKQKMDEALAAKFGTSEA